MKAIQVSASGGPDVLRLIDLPQPTPGPDDVLVKVAAAGINFADIVAREGKYPPAPPPPFVPGFEVAGTVEAVGANVTNLAPDARVFGLTGMSGGYAGYAILAATQAVPLPESVEFGAATALLIQGLTAYFLIEDAPLRAGESVLVNAAAGGVGSLAVQIAKLRGAGVVVGTASTDDKRRFVTETLGATAAVDYTKPGWGQAVKEATGGKGANVFLDATGDLQGEGFDALAEGGRWLIYGAQTGSLTGLSADRVGTLFSHSQSLIGFTLYPYVAQPRRIAHALREMLGWVQLGKLKIKADDRFPLADAAKAQQAISDRKTTGKVVLEP